MSTDGVCLDTCQFEDIVSEYLSEHPIYDLFKCPTCGVPWSDHESSCFYHHKKQYFDELRQIASTMDAHKQIFIVAKRNGYSEHSEHSHEFLTGMTARDSNGNIL